MFTRSVVLLAVAIMLQGCFEKVSIPQDERIDGVVRILMHEPGRYTLLVQEVGSPLIHERKVFGAEGCWISEVAYIPDVPTDQSMWLAINYDQTEAPPSCQYDTRLVFHIHDIQDINGAGWNHGKFGSGQTVVVE
ncbi:MAG: hypothetical protein WCW36_03275 [Candidatus Paceibacterota bacterium]|jgi:hypothetical protein